MSFWTEQKAAPDKTRDDWETPDQVLDLVRKLGPIVLDPCTSLANPTRARAVCIPPAAFAAIGAETKLPDCRVLSDGLSTPWGFAAGFALGEEPGVIFVNMPYGERIGQWTALCAAAGALGYHVIALPPARTDTKWFQRDCAPPAAQAVCFWEGRIQFVGAPDPAKFPSAISYWGPRKYRFADVFSSVGRIWL